MIAIIPARGGSKGLPGKNIKFLNGKPLICHTIVAALESRNITRVIVSTDDKEIATIAKDHGAEVPFLRPDYLSSDTAKAVDVYIYLCEQLDKESTGQRILEFVVLQPTSPLRNATHIDEAITLFRDKAADSVISYCEEHHPISWHKNIDNQGRIQPIFEDKLRNRQDEIPTYFPNGAIYIFKRSLIDSKSYITPNSYAYIMDRLSSVDIDSIEDFEYAEYLCSKGKIT